MKEQQHFTATVAVDNILPHAPLLGGLNGPVVADSTLAVDPATAGPFTLDCVKPVATEGKAVAETATPFSDTGSPYTQPLFDWLSFTFPVVLRVDDILELLVPSLSPDMDFEEAEARSAWVAGGGSNGYKVGYRRGNIAVYCDGAPDMGVNVQITGQGCRQLELEQGLQGEKCWQGFIRSMLAKGARFRRVDIAMDDAGEEPCLQMETIHKAVADAHVVSLFRTSTPVRDERLGRRSKGEAFVQSDTRYFGSRKNSNMFVRIYNKHLEQLQKLGFSAPEQSSFHWVRCELCARSDNAEAIITEFMKYGFKVIPSILRYYLDFKTPSETDTNPSRWESAPWWAKFLDNMEKRSLGVAPAVRTLEKSAAWIRKQAAPTLAMMVEAANGSAYEFFNELMSIVEDGRRRFTSAHRAMLKAHLSAFAPGSDLGGPLGATVGASMRGLANA